MEGYVLQWMDKAKMKMKIIYLFVYLFICLFISEEPTKWVCNRREGILQGVCTKKYSFLRGFRQKQFATVLKCLCKLDDLFANSNVNYKFLDVFVAHGHCGKERCSFSMLHELLYKVCFFHLQFWMACNVRRGVLDTIMMPENLQDSVLFLVSFALLFTLSATQTDLFIPFENKIVTNSW